MTLTCSKARHNTDLATFFLSPAQPGSNPEWSFGVSGLACNVDILAVKTRIREVESGLKTLHSPSVVLVFLHQ